jgi:hypothetical protein
MVTKSTEVQKYFPGLSRKFECLCRDCGHANNDHTTYGQCLGKFCGCREFKELKEPEVRL